jgi:NADH:ubiquinone oxidoreductase subunit 4 (subunit M)
MSNSGIFKDSRLLTPLLWLTVITIICSASAAFAQRDLKRMLAYSSVNHLGYCLLGIDQDVQNYLLYLIVVSHN